MARHPLVIIEIQYPVSLPWLLQVPLSKLKDSFNDGTSIAYIEELEQQSANH
jgi:hypothetical protein